MSKSKEYSGAEVKAGAFLLFSFGLLVAMLFLYGKASSFWKGRQEMTVLFNAVTALRPEAPVRFNGVEVGRVKNIQIVNLKEDTIKRLPMLGIRDLDNIPLTDEERLALKRTPIPPATATDQEKAKFNEDLNKEIQKKLDGRAMIELTLDLSAENNVKRYHVDDQVRISATLLGDTTVEIASGTGNFIEGAADAKGPLMLGQSGDFFTNLSKSVEQVKEILGSVSDVIGAKERESVRQSLRRFDSITSKVDNVLETVNKRLPATWNKVDDVLDSGKKDLDQIGKVVDEMQPKISQTLTSADEAVKDLQGKIGNLADDSRQAVKDVKDQLKPILEDVLYITNNSKEDVPLLIKNAKDLAARLKSSADRLDNVLGTGDAILRESYPDIRRVVVGLRMGAENFEEFSALIKRKPWLLLNPAKTEGEAGVATENARKLETAMQRFRDLSVQMQAMRRNLPATPNKNQYERFDTLIQELDVLLDIVNDSAAKNRNATLQEFQRKSGSLIKAPEKEATAVEPK